MNVNTFCRTFLRKEPALRAPAVGEEPVAGFPPPAPAPSSPGREVLVGSDPGLILEPTGPDAGPALGTQCRRLSWGLSGEETVRSKVCTQTGADL